MTFSCTLRGACFLGLLFVWVWNSGCYESPTPSEGYGLIDLPDTPPGYDAVLDAAASVIQERYPSSSLSRRSGLVLANTPVVMDGGSKTRKMISVRVLRMFTGAYEPEVRVRKEVEVGFPETNANPETANAALAKPVASNMWQTLDYLPYEEQELYDAIQAKVNAAGKPADEKGDEVPGAGGA